MAFANPYLSYSRLSRFEQCPLSYKLHYIDKQHSEPGIRTGKRIRYQLTPESGEMRVAWGPPFVLADAAAEVTV